MPVSIRTIIFVFTLSIFSIGASAQTDTKVVVIPLGGDDIKGLNFSGPQLNLPQKTAEAAGFSVCHSEAFNSNGTLISDILSKCGKPELMLACRPVGDPIFQIAAHAPRADVTYDTGANDDVTHAANGTEWYFSTVNSYQGWGFAPLENAVLKSQCDVAASGVTSGYPVDNTTPYRMCMHTNISAISATIRSGWRCGADISLDNSDAYERVFLHR